jgi:ABC-type transport system substrate-binding protein
MLDECVPGLIWHHDAVRSALRLGLMVVLAGCTQVSKTGEPRRGALRVGQLWPIRQLNPVLGAYGFDAEANYLVFDKLVWHGADGGAVPGLLEGWDVDGEGRKVVLKLRAGLQFHDGHPLTADDLIFTLDAIRDSRNESPYAVDLQIIESMQKLDERTVTIRLRHKSWHFPDLLDFGLLPSHLLRGQALLENPFNQHPIGAGPFRVVKMENDTLELARNPSYYGTVPALESLAVVSMDSEQLWRRLLARHIEIGLFIPWSKHRFLGHLKTIATDESTRRVSRAICFNSKRDPFARREARRAFADAIDRKALVDKTEFSFGIASNRLDPAEPDTTHFEIGAAKRELGGRIIHIAVDSNNSDAIDVAMNLQRQLSAADVTLQIDAYPTLNDSILKAADMTLCGFLDPRPLESFAARFGSQRNPEYKDIDEIFERIAGTQDEPTRHALFQKVEDRIIEDAPVIFLFWQTTFSAYRAEYCGYHMVNAFDGLEKMRPCP